jgi:hypothetical protein
MLTATISANLKSISLIFNLWILIEEKASLSMSIFFKSQNKLE